MLEKCGMNLTTRMGGHYEVLGIFKRTRPANTRIAV